ncbi:major capsid protein [Thaumasiovibrio subtropicus]|uniref:major capsid protein n=1 Tax=Thaumasiovibrio subtropicus TaxID=1891207 RepID=UPI000B358359|nr:major capsid protein [Thaumasiovibrio subtropicus]
MKFFNNVKKYGLGIALVGGTTMSSAHAYDLTAVKTTITEGTSTIQEVQLLVIGLAAVAMIGTWVKATFF